VAQMVNSPRKAEDLSQPDRLRTSGRESYGFRAGNRTGMCLLLYRNPMVVVAES
jgi:hypothetical protein